MEAVIRSLNQAGVRYLIVGGLAVVAHGYVRFTKDLDLVIALDPDNTHRALEALRDLGYRPVVPVSLDDFADARKRELWIAEKDARVFPLHSEQHRLTPVKLFLQEPFDFQRAQASALHEELAPGVEAVFVGLADLLEMKRNAGRPEDLLDIARLEEVHREDPGSDRSSLR